MKEIVIIDYGMCNLDSVARAVEKCGGTPWVSSDATEIENGDGIILPGVGAFADAMKELKTRRLVGTIRSQVLEKEKPFLGICLGMQLMADTGHEGGKTAGLGLIPGEIIRLESKIAEERIPHVGWNEVEIQAPDSPLFVDIQDRTNFYFVHSFHFSTTLEFTLATTPYCGGFISAVGRGHCFGTQFHPEKSLTDGFKLLENFLDLC
jgi:glutamine amidotransferase